MRTVVNAVVACSLTLAVTGTVRADLFSDVVDALSPDHYYRLNQEEIGQGAPDTGTGSPINGTFEGSLINLSANDPPVQIGEGVGVPGVEGPDVNLFGHSLLGMPGSQSFLANNSAAVNLGNGSNFANTTMTVAFWFRSGCPTENARDSVECQGPPASDGGDRLWTNNLSPVEVADPDNLDPLNTSAVDDAGHLQVVYGWGANLVVSIDPRFDSEANSPLYSNFQVPHKFNQPGGNYGEAGPDSGLQVKDFNWHHLVVSRNGDDVDNIMLMVDGVEIGLDRRTYSTDSWGTTGSDAKIGGRSPSPNPQNFGGWLDEVAVWLGRQLTAQEARSMWNAAHGLTADFNGDGLQDFGDLSLAVTMITDPETYAAENPTLNGVALCDANNDGLCNFGDLSGIAAAIAGPPPGGGGANVPEPTSLVLMLMGVLALSLRSRR